MKINYIIDTMIINGVEYPLAKYRSWLISNHEQLCSGNFIKAIIVGEKTRFTYDWQHIYFLADQYQFTKDYINEITSKGSESVPD